MKERPILFSASMVRAIQAGTKTQTRRIVKPQPSQQLLDEYARIRRERGAQKDDAGMLSECLPCPYGVPGDRLWVRETWHTPYGTRVFYRADHLHDPKGDRQHGIAWTPSIHMPRWASRITLEVTEVRVERLQDISEADARSEGVTPADCCDAHYHGFRLLWESINGPGSWDANPWVWVMSFRKAGGEG